MLRTGQYERTGQYKLARQTGGRGYYAVVQVEVSATTGGPSVEIECQLPEWMHREYDEAAKSGVRYALRHTGTALALDTIRVAITGIEDSPVDTCSGSVAFAACYATWNALGVPGENPPRFANKQVEFPTD